MEKAEKPENVNVKDIPHKEVRVIKSDNGSCIYPLKETMLTQPGSPKYEISIPRQLIQTFGSSGEIVKREAQDYVEDHQEDPEYIDRTESPPMPKSQHNEWHDIPSQQEDYWIVTRNSITRVHQIPRRHTYMPIEHDDDNPSSFPTR